jgi:hypothetical protein
MRSKGVKFPVTTRTATKVSGELKGTIEASFAVFSETYAKKIGDI